MTNSLITRCPKCSTAFRVTDDVLSVAKGKVRCGQCFHIFDALEAVNKEKAAHPKEPEQAKQTPTYSTPAPKAESQSISSEPEPTQQKPFTTDDEPVNPEWLQTLFDEDDLAPGTPDDPLFDTPKDKHKHAAIKEEAKQENSSFTYNKQQAESTKQPSPTRATPTSEDRKLAPSSQLRSSAAQADPAPWELELAEVEAALHTTQHKQPIKKEPHVAQKTPSLNLDKKPETPPEPEPEYMIALHSLAQSASEQTLHPAQIKQQAALEGISTHEYLDPLIGEYEKERKNHKKPRTWLWFLGVLFGLFGLAVQITGHFFVEGSHSEHFRVFYRTFCTYTGCTLPAFENINAISIQHVRIQSHPTVPNALVVNAIMTNNSRYAQPMPKIALEFFDLNGAPVAARLFAPKNYLDKDFLDITYMPPNTPIHIVIPIRDPGARAVTHQLRVFPAETKSY